MQTLTPNLTIHCPYPLTWPPLHLQARSINPILLMQALSSYKLCCTPLGSSFLPLPPTTPYTHTNTHTFYFEELVLSTSIGRIVLVCKYGQVVPENCSNALARNKMIGTHANNRLRQLCPLSSIFTPSPELPVSPSPNSFPNTTSTPVNPLAASFNPFLL